MGWRQMTQDLRPPLTALLESLELAVQRANTSDVHVPLKHATSSARRLRDLIGDLVILASESPPMERSRHTEASTLAHTLSTPGAVRDCCHILVVEDSERNSWVGSSMLEAAGHQVTKAYDGTQAVEIMASHVISEKLRQDRFNLILMSCSMPVMDGFLATAIIRWLEHWHGAKHVPVVALTASPFAAEREKSVQAGMCDYVDQSIGKNELLKRVTQPALRQQPLVGDTPKAPLHSQLITEYKERLELAAAAIEQAAVLADFPRAILEAERLVALCALPHTMELRATVEELLLAFKGAGDQRERVARALDRLRLGIIYATRVLEEGDLPTVRAASGSSSQVGESPGIAGCVTGKIAVERSAGTHAESAAVARVDKGLVAAAASTSTPAPDERPGINFEEAVANIGGDRAMTLRLLSKFSSYHFQTMATFEQALEKQAFDVIRREAHSLKGSCGYVAAKQLQAASIALLKAVDVALEGGQPDLPLSTYFERVRIEMTRVIEDIAKLVSQETQLHGGAAVSTPPDRGSLPAAPEKACARAPVKRTDIRPMGDGSSNSSDASPQKLEHPVALGAPDARAIAAFAATTAPSLPGFDEASDPTVLNWQEALVQFGGEEEILRRLLRKFCDRSAPTMDGLEESLHAGDLETLRRDVHSLSGSCGYIGATSLQAAAITVQDMTDQAIEDAANQMGGGGAARSWELITSALTRIKEEQKRLLLAIEYKLADTHSSPQA